MPDLENGCFRLDTTVTDLFVALNMMKMDGNVGFQWQQE
jgi:hypothetical protein